MLLPTTYGLRNMQWMGGGRCRRRGDRTGGRELKNSIGKSNSLG
jgi:hypothetical protein